MSTYIHALSALPLLDNLGVRFPRACVESLDAETISLASIMQLIASTRSLAQLRSPVHLIIPDTSLRRSSDWIVSHLWRHPISEGSFLKAADGAYLSSPEFSFLQMAATMKRIELIRLGYELCSYYRLDPRVARGFEERTPLTSKALLASFLDTAPRCKARDLAKSVLPWIAEGAASPRETATSMLCSLPAELGGWELGVPELNYELPVSRGRQRRVDLFWPARRYGLEYDSDAEHTGAEAIARDSLREKEIELTGVKLGRITNQELRSATSREVLRRTLVQALGKRDRPRSEIQRFLEQRLAATVLAPHATMV